MNYQSIVENELFQFSEKQLIIASRLYQEKLIGSVSEEAFYQSLGRLCDKGIIAKVSKGVYCRPRKTRYGVILPSEQEIVETFTKNETGMVVGYRLYNALNLTTQISKNSEIYSSGFEGKTKRIGNVNMTHYPLKYSREVIKTVEWLEVLNHYYEIQDLNRVAFQNFLSEYAKNYNEDVCEQVLSTMRYPKKTIAFAHQALNYHRRENSLERYLSSLSEYRIPNMEEIYETT